MSIAVPKARPKVSYTVEFCVGAALVLRAIIPHERYNPGMPPEHLAPEQLTDEELAAQYQASSGTAQAERWVNELFRRHYARVARWCFRFTGNRDSAADLAQEVFVRAYRNLHSFEGASKFSTWLYTVTRNHCLNAVKSRNESQWEELDAVIAHMADTAFESNPYGIAERASEVARVRAILNQALDETEKQVFVLHFADEMPLDAITRLLRLRNTSGAKAYIVSAKRKLQRSVARWKTRENLR